jgi:hypothetical protein
MDELVGKKTEAMNVLLGPAAERRCVATAKHTGERCSRAPIVGGFVCHFHGGAAPQTKALARRRLLAMVDPALDALLRALRMADACAHCGRADDMAVVVKAAQLVLDRAGLGPTAKLEVTTKPKELRRLSTEQLVEEARQLSDALSSTWLDLLSPDERREYDSLRGRMDALEAAAKRRAVVEGEVVRSETLDAADELARANRELEAAREELRLANENLARVTAEAAGTATVEP